MEKKKSNSYTWKYLENLKGDGVGGAFVAELWFPFEASLAILVQFLNKIKRLKEKSQSTSISQTTQKKKTVDDHQMHKQPKN